MPHLNRRRSLGLPARLSEFGICGAPRRLGGFRRWIRRGRSADHPHGAAQRSVAPLGVAPGAFSCSPRHRRLPRWPHGVPTSLPTLAARALPSCPLAWASPALLMSAAHGVPGQNPRAPCRFWPHVLRVCRTPSWSRGPPVSGRRQITRREDAGCRAWPSSSWPAAPVDLSERRGARIRLAPTEHRRLPAAVVVAPPTW